METRLPVEESFSNKFPSIYNHIRGYGGLKSQDIEKIDILRFFWKNDPFRENFQNCVPKGFIATPINVLC